MRGSVLKQEFGKRSGAAKVDNYSLPEQKFVVRLWQICIHRKVIANADVCSKCRKSVHQVVDVGTGHSVLRKDPAIFSLLLSCGTTFGDNGRNA